MISEFSGNIAPFIHAELNRASIAREKGNISAEFSHYENAHVLGQESTYWHVRVHVLMLNWAIRNCRVKEILGQLFRILGAATKTAFGWVPTGNTGGTNVSPFKSMPIRADLHESISAARSTT